MNTTMNNGYGLTNDYACGNTPVNNVVSRDSAAQENSFEGWLGGKAFGVIAAVLVLAGLGMLGAVIIPQLNDVLKAALVFAFAGLLMGGSAVLAFRKQNAFTTALLVCGAGSMIIAILLAHFHYGVIGATVSFALIAAWGSVCWGASCATRTFSLSIAAMAFMMARGFELMGDLAPHYSWPFVVGILMIAQFAVAMVVLVSMHEKAAALRVKVRNAHVATFVACEIALVCLWLACDGEYLTQISIAVFAAMVLGAAQVPFVRKDTRYYLPDRINEIVVLLIVALVILVSSPTKIESMLFAISLALVAALVVFRIRELPQAAEGSMVRRGSLVVPSALAYTFFLVCFLSSCTHLVDEPHMASAVLIACAIAAIVVGFRFKVAPLRLYGLALALLCALKMVTVDVAGLDSVSRVFAFVVSGFMCFAISALYNYASKRLQS